MGFVGIDEAGIRVSRLSFTFIAGQEESQVGHISARVAVPIIGFIADPIRTVKPPHVAESAFSMECTLQHWYELRTDDGTLSNTVILGLVKRFQAVCFSSILAILAIRKGQQADIPQKEFIFDKDDDMKVAPEKLRPVSRLGGITYGRTLQ